MKYEYENSQQVWVDFPDYYKADNYCYIIEIAIKQPMCLTESAYFPKS